MMIAGLVASGLSGCSSSKSSSFASYWADGDELCAHSAACGFGDKATCLAGWPTAADTTTALDDADVPDESIAACEAATRLLDKCTLGLSCENDDVEACSLQQMAFTTECALVLSAMDLFYKTHPRSIFAGPFQGSYDGSASGGFTGSVRHDGQITATIETPDGPISASGSVFLSGATTLSATADGVALMFTGTLYGTTAEFSGDGTWTAGADSGYWTLSSGQ